MSCWQDSKGNSSRLSLWTTKCQINYTHSALDIFWCGMFTAATWQTKYYGNRSFTIFSPRLWNGLPTAIRSADTIDIFKTSLKTHLFKNHFFYHLIVNCGVSWPSGLAYRTRVLVLAAECGFESRPWHLCPWARHLIIIASLHPGVKWVPVRAELVD